jgi:uncharacterized DUF497 family protein
MSLRFEWSESKAASNDAKHGVTFELAIEVFRDPFAMGFVDDRRDYREQRFIMIGTAGGHVLYVVYTEPQEDLIRLISARRATKHEQQAYFQ